MQDQQVSKPRRYVTIVAGSHDGASGGDSVADDLADQFPASRIEAGDRVVEQEDGGLEQQRPGQQQLFALAAGNGIAACSSHSLEPDPGQGAANGAGEVAAPQASRRREEFQAFVNPNRRPGRHAVRDVADQSANRLALLCGSISCHG